MATKTLGTGGDYATFVAAIAGIATWDVLEVITAGVYTEAAALAFSKSVRIVDLSGGQVKVQTPLGSHVGQISGGVTVEWIGDFVHEIRKPGSGGVEYNWLISGSGSDLVLNGVELKSDYTTGNTQAIYQQAGNSHHLTDCTITGQYEAVVRLATTCVDSVIDGLTITDNLEFVIVGEASGDMFTTFDIRRVVGIVSRAPIHNTYSGNRINVTTSGLMGACVIWGATAAGNMVLGTGAITVEKCTFDGSKAYLLEAVGGLSTGATVRDCEFAGFSMCGVYVSGVALAGLVDYCGVSNGCPALSNSAGSLGGHNQTSDPLFVDYANHDYHLLAGSPRIDAGTACIATVDPDGNVIPQGTAPDIGAFEWVPSVSPVTYESEYMPDATFICTDITGAPLPGFSAYDLFPAQGDPLVSLAQIVLISLFTDRVANPDDELPPGQTDRRGWFADTSTDKLGSRLWLDEGAAVDDNTLLRNRHFVEEALAHLTRDGLATSVEIDMDIVTDDRNPTEARLETEIRVLLDQKRGVILKFPDLWGL